jgi:threonine dehydrogenase-like Zn-dependent dehydrogenase
LVIGAGPIGLGTALFARIAGYEVTLLDASQERLDTAADRFRFPGIMAGADTLPKIMALTGNEGFEAVFDATGNARSMNAALPYVSHGGSLIFLSVVKDDITFADPEFHKREMMIIGSRNALKADFEHVVAMIRSGAVDTDKLVTHRTSLDSLGSDLPRWAHEKTGLIKAVVTVND